MQGRWRQDCEQLPRIAERNLGDVADCLKGHSGKSDSHAIHLITPPPELQHEVYTRWLMQELGENCQPDPSLCRSLQVYGARIDLSSLTAVTRLNEHQQKIVCWLRTFTGGIELSKECLDRLALDQGMGYKSANLVLSGLMLTEINQRLHHCEVRIPPSIPITDIEITFHLQKYAPPSQLFLRCCMIHSFILFNPSGRILPMF